MLRLESEVAYAAIIVKQMTEKELQYVITDSVFNMSNIMFSFCYRYIYIIFSNQ